MGSKKTFRNEIKPGLEDKIGVLIIAQTQNQKLTRDVKKLSDNAEKLIRLTDEKVDERSEVPVRDGYHSHFCVTCDTFCSESCKTPEGSTKTILSRVGSATTGLKSLAAKAHLPAATLAISAGCKGVSFLCDRYVNSKSESREVEFEGSRTCEFTKETTVCPLETCKHHLNEHKCYNFVYTVTQTKITKCIQETVSNSPIWLKILNEIQENETVLTKAVNELKTEVKKIIIKKCKSDFEKMYEADLQQTDTNNKRINILVKIKEAVSGNDNVNFNDYFNDDFSHMDSQGHDEPAEQLTLMKELPHETDGQAMILSLTGTFGEICRKQSTSLESYISTQLTLQQDQLKQYLDSITSESEKQSNSLQEKFCNNMDLHMKNLKKSFNLEINEVLNQQLDSLKEYISNEVLKQQQDALKEYRSNEVLQHQLDSVKEYISRQDTPQENLQMQPSNSFVSDHTEELPKQSREMSECFRQVESDKDHLFRECNPHTDRPSEETIGQWALSSMSSFLVTNIIMSILNECI